ncbi:DUF2252 family protein [Rhodanobacter sp. L36]|uniref:DUF2252 family protein n=1 Tax=Rhodanobacter sp. L36 TaxID=1747221 RepID=UPI00131A6EBF|nr:DUF2252 family protein [Rhodanobacter sp. L36]
MTKKSPGPAQRATLLTELREQKMARSAHAYVRGSTVRFYEWLDAADRRLPQGPHVWICGDCHVSNMGPVADAEGRVDVQIRDFDQTVIGNPAHDMIRLGLSLAMAARGSDLPGVITAKMMEQLILGYEQALSAKPGKLPVARARPESIQLVMKRALRRKWKHLAAERLEGTKNFWSISGAERKALEALMSSEEVHALVTSLSHRNDTDDVQMLGAAYWVKGCSSLGLLRYAVMLRVGESKDPNNSLCLIDIKEAAKAAAPRAANVNMPRGNAQRIVQGATALSPHLGERMRCSTFMGKAVFLRELLPQDLKLNIKRLSQSEAMDVAGYLGNVVGCAHARQMDDDARARWLSELKRNRSKSLDAPSWLWRSVVELVREHEGGYLEHCRRFAHVEA